MDTVVKPRYDTEDLQRHCHQFFKLTFVYTSDKFQSN
ncbi:MAG TPA: hypothetical protein LFW20_00940 [Rickettsia endosymbiont of Omalisus fontisbellaquei]|nr:hypothetical protein [Rickettsia endosymbiont of Omalisus fontisbellaquei]